MLIIIQPMLDPLVFVLDCICPNILSCVLTPMLVLFSILLQKKLLDPKNLWNPQF